MTDVVTIDFETYWDSTYTLSKMPTQAYLMDPRFEVQGFGAKINDGPTRWFPGGDTAELALRALNVRDAVFVCHNTLFDAAILSWHYGINPLMYLDTRFMANVWVKPFTGRAGLAICADYYGIAPKTSSVLLKTKGMRLEDMTKEQIAELGQYCIRDVDICRYIFKKLAPKFTKQELKLQDQTTRMYLDRRVTLNKDVLKSVINEYSTEVYARLERLGVTKTSLASNIQFAKLLAKQGVKVPRKISQTTFQETNALSITDPEFLALKNHSSAHVQDLVKARMLIKSPGEARRAERLLPLADLGPIGIPLVYSAAHTHRMGGSDGLNFQNLKSARKGGRIREAITVPHGHVLMAADQAQIEARLNALTAGQLDMVHQFAAGDDVYARFAERIYRRPITKERDPAERFVGKTGVLGLGYGAGKDKFAAMCEYSGIDISRTMSNAVVDTYRTSYSLIVNQWRMADNLIGRIAAGLPTTAMFCEVREGVKGILWLPNGMPLVYPHLNYTSGQWMYGSQAAGVNTLYGAKLVENVMQALARIIVMDQMMELAERGYRAVLQVHDEIVLCILKSQIKEAKRVVLETMRKSPWWAPNLPLECEVSVGQSYADTK